MTDMNRLAADRLPDVLLLVVNVAILLLANGDGRIFIISVITALTLRYVFLSVLVFVDWRVPGWFENSRLRRLVRDPSEGGAYDGGGAETPLWGHFVFLALFGWLPLFLVLALFDSIPLSQQAGWILAASAAVELRDIAAGRVIYFRSGAGQQRNASWNFTQVLVLAVSVITVPALIFPALIVMVLVGLATDWSYPNLFTDEVVLWVISAWILGIFHTVLFVDGARRRTA